MNVTFACPACDRPARVHVHGPIAWQCPACDHRLQLEPHGEAKLTDCLVCGNHEMYRKKDFPHGLGLAILTLACVASVFTYGRYEKWLTWAILIGTAVFDGVLYLLVGDAVVCYRCGAQYRRLPQDATHKPFELGVAERYRQERIRRAQLQAEKKQGP